jgi:hypothetical protein
MRLHIRRSAASAVVVVCLFTGCSSDRIVGSGDSHTATTPLHAVAPVLAGSFTAPAPLSRAYQTTYLPTGVTLPANTRVRITVTGKLVVTENSGWSFYCSTVTPWYHTQDPSCPTGAWANHSYGPLGVTPGSDASPLEVRFRVRAAQGSQEVRLSPWFYDGFQATAEFLNPNEGELEVGRGLSTCFATWSDVEDLFGSGSADCYSFSGSQSVRVEIFRESSRLTLSCPATVVRAESIACTAGSDPAGARVQVTDWKFEGGGFTLHDETDPHPLSWSGQMVQSGTVTVTGTVNGQGPQTASAQVSVTDRDWSQKAPVFTVQEIRNGGDSRLTLRAAVADASDLGRSDAFPTRSPADLPPEPVAEVIGGPNDGLSYFKDLSFHVYAYYVVNDAALSRGSSFYEAQPSENGTGSNSSLGGINWCGRSVVTNQLPQLVRAHELKHIEIYRSAFTRGVGNVLRSLEPRVSTSGADLDSDYDAAWAGLDKTARSESRAIHQQRGNPNTTTPTNTRGECALKNYRGEELKNAPDA